MTTNLAYCATLNRSETGGDEFAIGIAERDKPGYFPAPEHGTFPTFEAAGDKARDLNAARGVSEEAAAAIIGSSMAAQNRRSAKQ